VVDDSKLVAARLGYSSFRVTSAPLESFAAVRGR